MLTPQTTLQRPCLEIKDKVSIVFLRPKREEPRVSTFSSQRWIIIGSLVLEVKPGRREGSAMTKGNGRP